MTDETSDIKQETGSGLPEPVSPYRAGFYCKCPHCGKGPVYEHGLVLAKECSVCGFDLSAADTGDGAQVFVILILGAISAILGFILHGMNLPMWLIMVILCAVIIGGTVWMLRVIKATLVALQFHHNASEGVLAENGQSDSSV